LAMCCAFAVIVRRIISCIRICLAFGFVWGASEDFIKLSWEGPEHQTFVVRETSVIGNLGNQNLNESDEMNKLHWLKEIGNAATRG